MEQKVKYMSITALIESQLILSFCFHPLDINIFQSVLSSYFTLFLSKFDKWANPKLPCTISSVLELRRGMLKALENHIEYNSLHSESSDKVLLAIDRFWAKVLIHQLLMVHLEISAFVHSFSTQRSTMFSCCLKLIL